MSQGTVIFLLAEHSKTVAGLSWIVRVLASSFLEAPSDGGL